MAGGGQSVMRLTVRFRSAGLLCAVVFCLAGSLVPARAIGLDPFDACRRAIETSERSGGLPPQVLMAMGIVESGRPDPSSGRTVPWPWTVDAAGTASTYATKAEAIAGVRAAQAAGVQSIDVGCMQINLLQHPHAFSDLEHAFDPDTNVRYATSFLKALQLRTSDWGAAIAAYHSFTPLLGAAYFGRVAAIWPMASAYGPSHLAVATGPALPDVDPEHVLTPEFRSRLEQEAAFRLSRGRSMGLAADTSGDDDTSDCQTEAPSPTSVDSDPEPICPEP